ncbi:hypothetical protein [Aurantibacter aestuarii]|uniref:Uncharacterized protein n=1 Tax=Aurantibacter aestuarii TaxID=1266046 RepID=A0A2T1NE15_9FLAO|nr:hypothetical protein [Aurantibacter aestuarii]PSG90688.1 hypothetical protein C7H52_05265 [Aurantibacter aestuarii]
MKKILLTLILANLIWSCSEFETQTDVNNKFTIDIPKDWALQNTGQEIISIMRFTDTTVNYKERLLFDISWESDKTEFTPEFKVLMDSIAIAKVGTPKHQSFRKVNGFDGYYFDVVGKDSLGNFDFVVDNRYLNQKDKDGTIFLSITRWKEKLNETDSLLVGKIFGTLTRK